MPELFSYLQEEVDERPDPGRFILTGSQHFGLTEAITQSLAGRIAILYLLPPSLDELARFELMERFERLGVPVRIGPANLDQAREGARVARGIE